MALFDAVKGIRRQKRMPVPSREAFEQKYELRNGGKRV